MNSRELVEEMCDLQSGLTAWECDFISDMLDWDGDYTENQERKIQEIWERLNT